MEARRLYRSENDCMLAGVCGGVGEYFGVDATLVRLAFVLLAFFGGSGLVLYLVMWVIVPTESRLDAPPPDVARDGVADIRDRARDGAREARAAVDRLRGRRQAGAPPPEHAPPPGDAPPPGGAPQQEGTPPPGDAPPPGGAPQQEGTPPAPDDPGPPQPPGGERTGEGGPA